MTRRALLALLVLALAALACSVQPDTSGVTVYNVHGITRPTVTAEAVNTADHINSSGVKVWDLTPIATRTERP